MTTQDILDKINKQDWIYDEVISLLEKSKGWDDTSNIIYCDQATTSGGIWKFVFEFNYLDEKSDDRTLLVYIYINHHTIEEESWVDQKAGIKQALSNYDKIRLRLAYIFWCVNEKLDYWFEEDTPESDKICGSTQNKMNAMVLPETPEIRYNIF